MSPPREPSTPQAALHALVIELFSADEWRRWLRYGPDADLLPEVPEGGSLAELAERTLAALERRGRIDAAFFERLEAERPQRKAAVAAVAERWASSRGSTGPTGIRGPPVPPSSARQPTGAARIDVEGDFVAGSKTVHNHYYSAPPGVPAAPAAPATRISAPTATASTAEICRLGIQDIPSERLVGASSRPGRGTHVITLEAPIAGIPSAIENTEVQAALALDREMTRRRIGLNDLDPGGGDPGTWSRGRERIREAVRSYLVETVCTSDARHVSIFGLAPIPWLMALGYAISETVPSRVFTRLREPASWTWEDDRPELSRWSAHRLGEGGGARRAVILISASAAVHRERLHCRCLAVDPGWGAVGESTSDGTPLG